MYEIVRTARQQRQFECTWEYFCRKYHWYNDPYAENGIRYLITLPRQRIWSRKKVIGTIEFIPYDPNNPYSTVERRFEFSRYEDIMANRDRVWEIDKLCLHQDYQRKGYFHHFADIFLDHAARFKPKYYVALIEKRFYRMLRIVYGFHLEQRGNPLVGESTELVPMLFHIEAFQSDIREKKQMELEASSNR